MAKSRQDSLDVSCGLDDVIRGLGRLTPKEFRASLDERDVIAALRDKGYWEPKPGADVKGFTVADLWRFYMSCPSVEHQRAQKRIRAEKLRSTAAAVRAAVAAIHEMRDVVPPPWVIDMMGDDREMPMSRVNTGDQAQLLGVVLDEEKDRGYDTFEAVLIRYAERLERTAAALPRKRRPDQLRDRVVLRWQAFALERTAGRDRLDEIGAELFEIVFGEWLEAETYNQRVYRASKRAGHKPPKD